MRIGFKGFLAWPAAGARQRTGKGGDGYNSIEEQLHSFTTTVFGTFPTLTHKKISVWRIVVYFQKTGWCNKIQITNFMYAIIHHHLMPWFSLHFNSHIVKWKHLNTRMGPYLHSYRLLKKICIFQVFLNNVYKFLQFFDSSTPIFRQDSTFVYAIIY